jgi:ATP-dependent Lon protease
MTISKTILPKVLPLIPLRNVVLFPSVETSLFFGRPESGKSLLTAYDNYGRMVIITTQIDGNVEKPELKDVYITGVLARIEHILQTDGSMHSIVKGISRVKITNFLQTEPFILAQYDDLSLVDEQAIDIQKPAEALLANLKKAFSLGRQFDLPAMMQLSTGVSSSDLADQVSFAVNAKVEDKQKLLETLAVSIRLRAVTEILAQEMEVANLERDIETKTQEKFNTNMKRNVLEERKHQIEEELKKLSDKPDEPKETEFSELEDKIKKLKVDEDIKKKLLKEHKRLTQMGPMAPESSYIRTYLETVVELPFGEYSKNGLSILKSKNILDNDHYGL